MLDSVNRLRMIDVDPYDVPLEKIDVSQAELYEHDAQWGFFERLRREDPVHYCADSEYGPFWSVTKFNDIAQVEKNHQLYLVRADHHHRRPAAGNSLPELHPDGPAQARRAPRGGAAGGGAGQPGQA